jgi:glycosyltransferase involved in cell wall biosynthesis
MNVSLVTGSKAHTLDLARELEKRGLFHELIIGYPRAKLGSLEGIPAGKIVTSPLYHAPMIGLMKAGLANSPFIQTLERLGNARLDRIAAERLNGVDVLISMAGAGRLSGPAVQRKGGKWICDRGAAHIAWQKKILDPEYDRLGILWQGISSEKVAREIEEYDGADRIYVPSEFVRRTFIDEGISPEKVEVHSLGVNLTDFRPDLNRQPNEVFTILGAGQMGVQKGLQVLLDVAKQLSGPFKLQWAGLPLPEANSLVTQLRAICEFEILGHLTAEELVAAMNQADVFVLPSIQDGFGMVATQAMACATPVILSTATGAAELIRQGENGFTFLSRDAAALAAHLETLRSNPDLASALGLAARQTVTSLGGWTAYGDSIATSLQSLTSL